MPREILGYLTKTVFEDGSTVDTIISPSDDLFIIPLQAYSDELLVEVVDIEEKSGLQIHGVLVRLDMKGENNG